VGLERWPRRLLCNVSGATQNSETGTSTWRRWRPRHRRQQA
jgi:hypothetical protein